MHFPIRAIVAAALTACWINSATSVLAVETPLAAQKKALQSIIVAPGAGEKTKQLAATLAEQLGRISGATFTVITGDGTSGIAVGTAGEFPALKLTDKFDPKDLTQREDYVLRSHAGGVQAIGGTELGAQHAVWDLLHRLGHRQFFPSAHWEVVPNTPDLRMEVDAKEHPDYLARRVWYGFGSYKPNMQDKAAWDAKNRMANGLNISSGHAYDRIYKENKAEFDKHPEYLVSTQPVKFCVSNPGLRQLVIDDALRFFAKNPTADSISLEPSDGGGWEGKDGECPDAKVYASVSDRVVTLANEVAKVVNEKYPGKFVGIYAYFQHSAPPTIPVHPQVSVNVATAFIQGGLTFEQLMTGWQAQGAKVLGVREYYSVFDTHRDKPGGPGGSDPRKVAANIARYHAMGGRLMSAESTESWATLGLTHYLASRVLWNTEENVEGVIDDFFAKAFGPAEKPMREFYRVIDRGSKPLFSRDLLGRMYRQLDAARKLTNDPAIRARLDDLVLYTRYSEMLYDFDGTKDKLGLGADMLRFTARMNPTGMMHAYVFWRHDYKVDKSFTEEKQRLEKAKQPNPLWVTTPFTAEEIDGYVRAGIKANPVAEFTPVTYSQDLVPATPLKLTPGAAVPGGYTRGAQTYYVWFDKPGKLKLQGLGGQIATTAKTTLTLTSATADAKPESAAKPESTAEFDNDKQSHDVELTTTKTGLHKLQLVDRGKGASLVWPEGTKIVIESSNAVQTLFRGAKGGYFYVPKGTKVLGGYAGIRTTIVDGDDKPVAGIQPGAFFSVPVPPGQDGKLWRADRITQLLLMTVPPYIARGSEELLLPKEVVEADKGKRK